MGITPDEQFMQKMELWVESRFNAEFVAIAKVRAEMDAHRAALEQNSAENQEILAMMRRVKVFIGLLGVLERVSVWVVKLGAGVVVVWGVWKYIITASLVQIIERGSKP